MDPRSHSIANVSLGMQLMVKTVGQLAILTLYKSESEGRKGSIVLDTLGPSDYIMKINFHTITQQILLPYLCIFLHKQFFFSFSFNILPD